MVASSELHHWQNGHEFEQTLGDKEGIGKPGVLQSIGSQRIRQNLTAEKQQKANREFLVHIICSHIIKKKKKKTKKSECIIETV